MRVLRPLDLVQPPFELPADRRAERLLHASQREYSRQPPAASHSNRCNAVRDRPMAKGSKESVADVD